MIRVVDAKDSPTLSIRSFTGIDFSLSFSLEFTCTTGPKLPKRRNVRESCEELGHTIGLGLPVHTITHPSKDLHIATLFRAPVNDVGDKFGSAPTGLGFHRRGAPERQNGTKR